MNKLIIRKKEWAAILKNCCQDKDNSNSIQVPRIITGSIFAKEINNIEKMDFKLNVKHGRIYKDKNKKSKYYFMCHAYCSICGTQYIFSFDW